MGGKVIKGRNNPRGGEDAPEKGGTSIKPRKSGTTSSSKKERVLNLKLVEVYKKLVTANRRTPRLHNAWGESAMPSQRDFVTPCKEENSRDQVLETRPPPPALL